MFSYTLLSCVYILLNWEKGACVLTNRTLVDRQLQPFNIKQLALKLL